MVRSSWRGWIFLIGTTALALIAAFLPALVGAGWHLLYGSAVHYHNWGIPVPHGWFAMRQGEGVTLERMVHFALWQDTPTAVFLPIHTTPQFVFDLQVWEEEQIKIQAVRGYKFQGGHPLVVAGHQGYCWEFAALANLHRLWITCIVPADRISADFSGNRAYVSAFYSILPGITRDHPSR